MGNDSETLCDEARHAGVKCDWPYERRFFAEKSVAAVFVKLLLHDRGFEPRRNF
jgi:hypothetical protein